MNLLKKILPKDSFYLILFVCVGVLGTSAVWVAKSNVDNPEKLEAKKESGKVQITEEEIKLDLREENVTRSPKKDIDKNLDIKEENPILKEETKPEAKPEVKPEPKVNKEQNQNNEQQNQQEQQQKAEQTESVASSQVSVKNVKMKRPVEGKIYKDFANDKLVYSKTLEEWSVHLGIDIAVKEGTLVKAAYDGIVKTIENDGKLGITITLDHGSGLETVYKNISTADMVKIGQKVKTGDTISKVSRGLGFEKLDEPHLHFEVLESGTRVDPKGFF